MYEIIINPASRSGQSVKIWNSLEPTLKSHGLEYQTHFSQRIGHISEIVSQLTNRNELTKLIVFGGDGTMNEVLQGIKDFSRVQVGYIPSGSSNDLARDLQLSNDPAEILEKILHCTTPKLVDVGVLSWKNDANNSDTGIVPSTRYFAVSSGIGFDAAVCEEALTSTMKKFFNRIGLGKLTYVGIAVKQLIAAKHVSCDITLDNKESFHLKQLLFLAAMIHQYEGGGFKFCPGADDQDGILDICVASTIKKPLILFALPFGFAGKHYMFKGIDKYTAQSIHIVTSAPLFVHTDGEVHITSNDITLSCKKQALSLLL